MISHKFGDIAIPKETWDENGSWQDTLSEGIQNVVEVSNQTPSTMFLATTQFSTLNRGEILNGIERSYSLTVSLDASTIYILVPSLFKAISSGLVDFPAIEILINNDPVETSNGVERIYS